MKIALISDIHANLAALRTVLQDLETVQPDAVIVGGDVINRGPQPRECLEAILDRVQHGWNIIRGNHEDYVLRAASGGLDQLSGWEQGITEHSRWTARWIPDLLPAVAGWPEETEVTAPDGSTVLCLHASIKGNRVGMYTHMLDDELLNHTHPRARVFGAGHTHIPFIRHVEGRMIVNAGAVGMPFDGDPRASYALIEWRTGGWSAEIIRLAYDRGETRKAFESTGYLQNGGPMVPLILQELDMARPRLGYWHRLFERSVADGSISLEASIEEMLKIA